MKDKIIKNFILIISILIYIYLVFIGRNQYIYNISYTKIILFVLLICLMIYLYGIINNKEKIYNNNIKWYIALYLLLLISVTFFIGRTDIKFYNWWYRGQYEPFHTIISHFEYGSTSLILKNIIGNSIMLIPLSFLLMIKNKKYKNIFSQTLIILPLIIAIEVLQAYTHVGVFDIDDILLNYFGTIIFTFLITRFSIIDKIKTLFYTDYSIKQNIKNILFYISIIILIMYIIIVLFKLF